MPTLEDRLAAYRDVLDDAIERRSDETAPHEGGRRWPVLVPALGVVATGALVLGVVAVTGHGAEAPAPAATGPAPTSILDGAPTVPLPAPTVPLPTTIPTTVAMPPTEPPVGSTVAIGDGVMLGAADELAAAGVLVDASVSRWMPDTIGLADAVARQGPAVVVVHLQNGGADAQTIDRFFGSLADVPRVVVLTGRAPGRSYVDEHNATLRALPERYPNVVVLDWAVLADACPGPCFYADGIHLRQEGQTYYARLVLDALARG